MPDYTALFEVLGQYARTFALLRNLADRDLAVAEGGETFRSLDRLRKEFITVLNGQGSERDRLDAVQVLADAARLARGWAAQMQASLDAWVREGVAAELSLSGSTHEVLRALASAMVADGESIARNTVSLGAPQAAATNAGSTACYVAAQAADPAETVVSDERAQTQLITVHCVRDSAHHRLPKGQEEFRIAPEHGAAVAARVIPVTVGAFDDTRNAVRDGAFSDYASGAFTHWETGSGAGAISQETSNRLFGAGCLKLTGNGATAAELTQDLAERDPALPTGRFWALGAWVYVSSLSAGTVTVDVLVDGAPWTPALTIDGSTPTGQWLHLGGIGYVPRAAFPNLLKVRVRCSSTFNGVVLVNGAALAPTVEVPHAGLQLALFEGALAPQALPVADRFTIAATSNDAGAFQCFFRDRLGLAMPSAASPTIADSLAE